MSKQQTLATYGDSTAQPDGNDPERYKNPDWLREQYVKKHRSAREMAERVKVSESTVFSWLERHGVEIRDPAETYTNGRTELLRDESWLREQYLAKKKSTIEIADGLGCGDTTVSNWLDIHEIPRRDKAEARAIGNVTPLQDREWLNEQYVFQFRSTNEIADELGVSDSTVSNWLERHGIATRSGSESKMPEGAFGRLQDEDWLRDQHVEQRRTLGEIATELGVSHPTISKWLDKHEIEIRHNSTLIPEGARKKLMDHAWLREQYVEKRRTTYEIADDLEVSYPVVRKSLKENGIRIRSKSEAQLSPDVLDKLQDESWLREQYIKNRRPVNDIADALYISENAVRRWLEDYGIRLRSVSESRLTKEAVDRLRDESWLRQQYVEDYRSMNDIADELGIHHETVRYRLAQYGIEIRSGIQDPNHLNHLVRSTWELEIAEILSEYDVEYEYEGIEINRTGERIYTPDFVTDEYIIEVKGRVFEDRNEEEKALAAMEVLHNREYIVVGTELPCDVHIPWEDRESLIELFN